MTSGHIQIYRPRVWPQSPQCGEGSLRKTRRAMLKDLKAPNALRLAAIVLPPLWLMRRARTKLRFARRASSTFRGVGPPNTLSPPKRDLGWISLMSGGFLITHQQRRGSRGGTAYRLSMQPGIQTMNAFGSPGGRGRWAQVPYPCDRSSLPVCRATSLCAVALRAYV